ncbi:MAG: PadR family transcriptional regulator [Acidimicrobiales bacterium]
MIDLAILGLVKEQELHGYELRKRVAELLGPGRGGLSFGSLYPALNRLERAGHVKAVEANTRPPLTAWSSGSLAGELAAFRTRLPRPGSRGGRSRKVYGITSRGEAHLVELLTEPGPTDERTFALRVVFCHRLNRTKRLELFHRRRAELTDRLAELAKQGRGQTTQHRYLRSLREHDLETITCDLAWLDRLIADERPQARSEQEKNP